jgi:general secretion pathway protein M
MNFSVSPLASRLFALLLLIAVLVAVWSLVVAPVHELRQSNDVKLAQSQELIVRYQRLAATRDRLQRQTDELHRRAKATTGYLEGASPALAAAALQNTIKRLVTRHGGTIKSAQMLSPKEENGLQKVPVRIQLSAELPALQKILHAFETGATYLFLEDLNIRASRARPARRSRGPRRSTPLRSNARMLSVRVDMYGYIRPGRS